MGVAVAVETTIGAEKPSFFKRVFLGQKPTPGVTIYVCCRSCADAVRRDPATYVAKVIAERGGGRSPEPSRSGL